VKDRLLPVPLPPTSTESRLGLRRELAGAFDERVAGDKVPLSWTVRCAATGRCLPAAAVARPRASRREGNEVVVRVVPGASPRRSRCKLRGGAATRSASPDSPSIVGVPFGGLQGPNRNVVRTVASTV
jgi:hypothetical protein